MGNVDSWEFNQNHSIEAFCLKIIQLVKNSNYEKLKKVLEQKNVMLNTITFHPRYTSPLIIAARHGESQCAEVLIKYGCDVNYKPPNSITALVHACTSGHSACVKVLLDHGADPNIRTVVGRTALTWACPDHPDCVALLLQYGADVNIADDQGKLPFDYGFRKRRRQYDDNVMIHQKRGDYIDEHTTTADERIWKEIMLMLHINLDSLYVLK
jgi:ankyrin repeat protein